MAAQYRRGKTATRRGGRVTGFAMDDAYLHIDNVTKRFGVVTAVDAAQIAIRRGEFFSLLGPSGCGKTTLLRMIAGFEYPSEGEIYIDGSPITDLPPNKRPSNMVFQSYAIFPHLNVADNIAYGLRKLGISKRERAVRVAEALAVMKLEGFENRKADQLSGGQRQRVALARALINRPKVLLLDEPLGALDKRLRETMQLELRQLQRSVGITFVFVTHDQEEALSMSDRVAVMSGGKVLQIAEPRVLYEQPNCREVADFIGTMNFFDGIIVSADADYATVEAAPFGQFRVPLTGLHSNLSAPGTPVLIALRPEKITLKPSGSTGVHAVVQAASYLGERSHVLVAAEGLPNPVSVALQNAGGAGQTFQKGERVSLDWPADALVILPRQ
jgi:spermidine/putrescine ABC transporter ATP-binding subunit